VRYWRDPLVVSTTPAAGSSGPAPGTVTIRFQRDVTPAGADYAASVAVQGPGGAVAGTTVESEPGVLTWTPAAPLSPGTYEVTVDAVLSALGAGSVPIRTPYRFTFTVT
jgi:hypothetical protein